MIILLVVSPPTLYLDPETFFAVDAMRNSSSLFSFPSGERRWLGAGFVPRQTHPLERLDLLVDRPLPFSKAKE